MFHRAATSGRVALRSIRRGMGTNPNPPPNAARGATADLCDVFVPEPVDQITERKVQIAEPIFRYILVDFLSIPPTT